MSCVQTFGTRKCKLCAKERYEILKLTRNNPRMAINKCNEVHGACRHKPRFHRFDQPQIANTSTDESMQDERVTRPSSTTSVGSSGSELSISSFSDRRESSTLQSSQVTLSTFDENRLNGLQARYHFDPGDLPHVDSNLEKPPQEDEDLVLAEGLTVDL